MNERENRNEPTGPHTTGNFKVNIDESELAAGEFSSPEYEQSRNGQGRNGQGWNSQSRSASYGDGSYNRAYATEEERRAEKKAHKKRDKLKARKNKRVFSLVWLCMVLLASFTLASYLIGGSNDFFAVGRAEGTTEVEIPAGVDADGLAKLLQEKGAIKKPEFFSLYSKITVDDWKYFEPGVYQLNTNMDYEDILNTLQGGNESMEVVTVTFPEGVTALQAAQLLEENEVCTQEEFLTALNGDFTNYEEVAAIGDASGKYYKLEGYLFPDTYDFWKGEEIESVVGKMLNNFHEKMSDATMAKVEQSGMTLDQVITLASIIQNEAANDSDMYNVSAVLHNRLSFGADYGIYYLQCDSTTFYPYKNQEEIPAAGALSYGNYDTYKIEGLPAGAICNPGMDAIQAALNPSTDGDAPYYLYFCHAADGTPYYAVTEEGHLENRIEAGLD